MQLKEDNKYQKTLVTLIPSILCDISFTEVEFISEAE